MPECLNAWMPACLSACLPVCLAVCLPRPQGCYWLLSLSKLPHIGYYLVLLATAGLLATLCVQRGVVGLPSQQNTQTLSDKKYVRDRVVIPNGQTHYWLVMDQTHYLVASNGPDMLFGGYLVCLSVFLGYLGNLGNLGNLGCLGNHLVHDFKWKTRCPMP